MTQKRKITLIIVIIMLIGILLITFWLYYKPTIIQKEINTMQYQNNNVTYEEPISLQIIGKYHNRLFKEDYFEGKIQISGYPFTYELGWDLGTVSFDEGYGHLFYDFYQPEQDRQESKMDILHLGFILCTPNFEQFTIILYDEKVNNPDEYHQKGLWSSENGLFISYPATNRNEAIDILNSLMKKNERLSKLSQWK